MIKKNVLRVLYAITFGLFASGCSGNVMFKSSNYASKIVLRSAYVSGSNIKLLYENGFDLDLVAIRSPSEVKDVDYYIVITAINNGSQVAWGELGYEYADGYGDTYHVSVPGLSPGVCYMFSIPVHGKSLTDNMINSGPKVHWLRLYSK